MRSKTTALASAAALLFVAGGAQAASHAEMDKGKGEIKCEGVNSCKGHSDCQTATSDCAGHNSCKGKGFKMLSPEECKEAKAAMMKDKSDHM